VSHRRRDATFQEYVGPVISKITQSADQMSVEMTRGPKAFSFTYKIYASAPTAENAPAGSEFRAYWNGERLVTETDQNIQNQTVTTREVRSLLAGGKEMLVERVVQVQHGYTLRGAQNYSTDKGTFVKAAP
jgi:hypothetical protein